MKIFTKTVLVLSLAMPLSLLSISAHAEEAAAVAPAAGSSAVIANIDKALVEISKSDFSAAQVFLKAARNASDKIADSSDVAKKAHAILIQGQIQSKNGNVSKATEVLNNALDLYKTL